MKKKALAIAAASAMVLATGSVQAHEAGNLILRVGAATVAPDDSSSQVMVDGAGIGGRATVNNNTQLGLTMSYMFTDNLALGVLAATPFKHRVALDGLGALDGKFADVKHLPPTLTLQYFPLDKASRFQPYVGAGLNYTTFFSEKLTATRKAQGFSGLSLKDSWGLALEAGVDWKINDRLLINAAVWHIDIDTKATARLGNSAVRVNVDIDPWVYMVGIGYRF
ncbi:MAG: OmpW/AlkL family protein [Rhodocyclaceae bacterium]